MPPRLNPFPLDMAADPLAAAAAAAAIEARPGNGTEPGDRRVQDLGEWLTVVWWWWGGGGAPNISSTTAPSPLLISVFPFFGSEFVYAVLSLFQAEAGCGWCPSLCQLAACSSSPASRIGKRIPRWISSSLLVRTDILRSKHFDTASNFSDFFFFFHFQGLKSLPRE
jgi:hypothetical protein